MATANCLFALLASEVELEICRKSSRPVANPKQSRFPSFSPLQPDRTIKELDQPLPWK